MKRVKQLGVECTHTLLFELDEARANSTKVRHDRYSGGMASMEEDLDAFVEKKSFRRMAKEAETPSPVRRLMNDPSRAGKTAAEIANGGSLLERKESAARHARLGAPERRHFHH